MKGFKVWQLGLMVLLFMGISAHAEVYRWVDDQGRVHFGERPPEKVPKKGFEKVKVRQGNVVDPVKMVSPSNAPSIDPPSGTVSEAEPGSPLGKGGVVARQTDCAAKNVAYEASRACFDACGQTVCSAWGCKRNNSHCSHCTDLPKPHC